MSHRIRLTVFLLGNLLVGLGVGGLLHAHLGVAPFDVTNSGLAARLGVDVGTASWFVGATMVTGAVLLGRRPRVGTLAAVVLVGLAINLAVAGIPTPGGWSTRLALLGVALVTLWSGITCLVLARYGAGPLEELMLALAGRGVPLRTARWGLEAGLTFLGVVLGGQLGVATVLLVVGTGPVLAAVLPPLERRLHEPVHVEVPPTL